jgi:hypothetical protein
LQNKLAEIGRIGGQAAEFIPGKGIVGRSKRLEVYEKY